MVKICLTITLIFSLFFTSCSENKIEKKPIRIHIIGIGDIVAHTELTRSGLYGRGFNSMFLKLRPYFNKADFVIANFEAPVAENLKPSGYPRFNAHPKLAKAAKQNGIDFFSVANTHSLDKGAKGISGTINTLKKLGILFNGMNKNSSNHYKPTIVNIKGIKCAIFSVVKYTNMNKNPRGKKTPKVNTIKTENEIKRSIKEIKKIRPKVDLIILTLHIGVEKKTKPGQKQRNLAKRYSDAGVDIIFGSHPHVLQPFEFLNNRTFCIYSLSNILSYMARGITIDNYRFWDWRTPMGDGVLMHVFVEKNKASTKIVKIGYTPTWTIAIPSKTNKFNYHYYATPLKEEIKIKEKYADKFYKNKLLPLLRLRREYIIKMYGKKYLIEGLSNFNR